ATPSGPSSLRTSSEGGPECHFTMGDSPVQARPERLSNLPNEPPLEEARLAQENIAQAKQWDDVQAQIQADENLAQRMLEEERESLSIKERFVPMESEGQATNSKAGEGSSKAGESLKRSAKEELGHEQKVEEEITQQEDVVAKQAEKESSKKAGGRLKIKTSKARENKDKRQKKHDDPENLHL
nr:hypothetical protein [Tanacetum cinerariifolium]